MDGRDEEGEKEMVAWGILRKGRRAAASERCRFGMHLQGRKTFAIRGVKWGNSDRGCSKIRIHGGGESGNFGRRNRNSGSRRRGNLIGNVRGSASGIGGERRVAETEMGGRKFFERGRGRWIVRCVQAAGEVREWGKSGSTDMGKGE